MRFDKAIKHCQLLRVLQSFSLSYEVRTTGHANAERNKTVFRLSLSSGYLNLSEQLTHAAPTVT